MEKPCDHLRYRVTLRIAWLRARRVDADIEIFDAER